MTDDERRDRSLEHGLEQWFEATAEPLPPGVLGRVMDEVPTARRARRPLLAWTPGFGRIGRSVPVVPALAALVILVVVIGAGPWLRALVPSTGTAPSPPSDVAWDPALDAVANPDHRNPAPDRAGRPNIWFYLARASSGGGAVGPALLGYDTTVGGWTRPPFTNLLVQPVGKVVRLHSSGSGPTAQDATLGWESPMSGSVHVTGTIRLADPLCATGTAGMEIRVDRGGVTLELQTITRAPTALDLVTHVEPGTVLYVVLSADQDSPCNTAELQLMIRPA